MSHLTIMISYDLYSNTTFILASSKMGKKMNTGSTGVAEYRRPSVDTK